MEKSDKEMREFETKEAKTSDSLKLVEVETKRQHCSNLVFKSTELAGERLQEFNKFCFGCKAILNKHFKSIMSSRESQNANSIVKDFIKSMPHVLDFENKRALFKREIKKLKKQSGVRNLTLYIRRSEIFMDAYS
jgi:hypothetical protein